MGMRIISKLIVVLSITVISFSGCGSKSEDSNPGPVVSKWTHLIGIAGKNVGVTGITLDSDSNSYIIGDTNAALDGESVTGTRDIYVIKYNSSGVKQWTKLIGVAGAQTYGKGIAVDSSGNIYITGYTDGNLGGETKNGSFDAFVIKYNSSRVMQWTRLSGVASTSTFGYGISVDSAGNSYIVGFTYGNLDTETLNGTCDAFIIKYNSSGAKQWTRLSGAAGADTEGNGISVDSSGNSYIAGYTDGSFDGETLTGTYDAFVIKYDTDGNRKWTDFSGVAGADTQASGISVDSVGNSYVCGYTKGGLDGETLTGTCDAFVIKYNSSGAKQWTRLSGAATKGTSLKSISVDSDGSCYTTGDTSGNLDGETLTGTNDVCVIRYDTDGNNKSTKLLGVASSTTSGKGISVDYEGNIFLTGTTTGNLDGKTLTGTMDTFVTTRLNP